MSTTTSALASVTSQVVSCTTTTVSPNTLSRPPVYKAIGITLAIASGLFIGTSFVLKKVGLLRANVKYNEEAGEGYGYLKNAFWWTGMTLMIIGEICNFVAYAFVDAILVTPLGALSVVITTILSAIFLKERLSFVGKVGCFMCIIGSIVIVMNAPEQSSAATIQEMQSFVIAPGFLSYAGVIIIGCAFIAFWAGPRYGKKSMLVYLSVCSLIGGLSVVATQGLGAAVVAQAGGTPQFNQWFLYVLLVFVVGTLLTEIIYLNKALNLFNAALVTPTYYVYFTSSTIVASAILFRGFKGTPISIATMIMGFLQICAGVVLLQLSKSAKDVPDTAVLKGDLNQIRTVGEQEQPESEPKADAIRGAAALIRRISQSRQKMEADEARKVYEEKLKDQMEPIAENEQVEWDGLRRRKTIIGEGPGSLSRRKTLHPPLGLTKFPSYDESKDEERNRPTSARNGATSPIGGILSGFRRRTSSSRISVNPALFSPRPQGPLTEANEDKSLPPDKGLESENLSDTLEMQHVYGMPPSLRPHGNSGASSKGSPGVNQGNIMWASNVTEGPPSRGSLAPPSPGRPHTARRQFSFQNVFHRNRDEPDAEHTSRKASGSRHSEREHRIPDLAIATEEERLGLVKGDSHTPDSATSEEESVSSPIGKRISTSDSMLPLGSNTGELSQYETQRHKWSGGDTEIKAGGNRKTLPQPPKEDEYSDNERDFEKARRDLEGGSGRGGGAFI